LQLSFQKQPVTEEQMSETTPRAAPETPQAKAEDQAIRERARLLTSEVLKHGRVDTDGIQALVRAMTGSTAADAVPRAADSSQSFADAVRDHDTKLAESTRAVHLALERLASRGADVTDNDLKEALLSLRQLEQDYVALTHCLGDAMSGSLRRELTELAAHAQSVGADTGTRVAGMLGEFANRMSENTASGIRTMQGAGMGMALLASGVLAGIADALREQSEAKPDK
jgi:Family of unknown function (DUF6781)